MTTRTCAALLVSGARMAAWLALAGCADEPLAHEADDASIAVAARIDGAVDEPAATTDELGVSALRDAEREESTLDAARPDDARPDASDLDAGSQVVRDAALRTSVCKVFTPLLDAEAPVFLTEPLASQCEAWLAHPPAEPTKGGLPFPPTGSVWESAPDYVRIAARDVDVEGYVSKYDLLCDVCSNRKPVVDASLRRLIGHMVSNIGFVPLSDAGL